MHYIKASDHNLVDVPVRIRENPGGGKVAQLYAPMGVASNMAEYGYIKVGWSICRVELLEHRKLTCHRCLHQGHFKAEKAEKKCFLCRKNGHLVAACPRRLTSRKSSRLTSILVQMIPKPQPWEQSNDIVFTSELEPLQSGSGPALAICGLADGRGGTGERLLCRFRGFKLVDRQLQITKSSDLANR